MMIDGGLGHGMTQAGPRHVQCPLHVIEPEDRVLFRRSKFGRQYVCYGVSDGEACDRIGPKLAVHLVSSLKTLRC